MRAGASARSEHMSFEQVDNRPSKRKLRSTYASSPAPSRSSQRHASRSGRPEHQIDALAATVAVQTITAGLAAMRSTGATVYVPTYLSSLARAYADLGRFDDAWRSINEAFTAAEATKERMLEAEISGTAGEIALMQPKPDRRLSELCVRWTSDVPASALGRTWSRSCGRSARLASPPRERGRHGGRPRSTSHSTRSAPRRPTCPHGGWSPAGALHRQLALEHGEALDESGMAVLANNPRSDERGELGSRAALGVLVGKLEDRGALAGDGVLPDLTDLDRRAIRRAVRVGCDIGTVLTTADPPSTDSGADMATAVSKLVVTTPTHRAASRPPSDRAWRSPR